MKKKLLIILLIVSLAILTASSAFADAPATAAPTSSSVVVNGTPVEFDSYNIDGSNFFKLRELAYMLSGTPKQFNVDWDRANNAILLFSSQQYKVIGGELQGKGAGHKKAVSTASVIYLDGIEIKLTAYNIENNNYFKLRDIGEAFDFSVVWDAKSNTVIIDTTKGYTPEKSGDTVIQVLFLDVGQADCILIKTENHAMLIDAGNTNQDSLILGYLSEYGVTELDYMVATHPHADHIGSISSVINTMDKIGEIIMPDRPHTTKTYENFLLAAEKKGIDLTIVKTGDSFAMGRAEFFVLAPDNAKSTSDLNECSIVLRMQFGDIAFLFTGDAGTRSESEQLKHDFNFKADVLKVGHHGSRTSSTQKYLDVVSPAYAVIMCGEGNTYGHPHSEAMARLTGMGAKIYRTDENGTIIFETDGVKITVSVEKITEEPIATTTYIGNKNTKIFHLPSCRSLPQEANRVYFDSRQDALNAGYSACSICKP